MHRLKHYPGKLNVLSLQDQWHYDEYVFVWILMQVVDKESSNFPNNETYTRCCQVCMFEGEKLISIDRNSLKLA